MGGEEILCRPGANGAQHWLRFKRLHCVACAPPPWWRRYFHTPPALAALAGGADGYLLLCWPDGFDLTCLQPPGPGLARDSGRAIIATSAATSGTISGTISSTTNADDSAIHLRYFAPQYGVVEDAATGSAVRVLADFWRQRGRGPELRYLQQSGPGGELLSHLQAGQDGHVWIGGRVVADSGDGGSVLSPRAPAVPLHR